MKGCLLFLTSTCWVCATDFYKSDNFFCNYLRHSFFTINISLNQGFVWENYCSRALAKLLWCSFELFLNGVVGTLFTACESVSGLMTRLGRPITTAGLISRGVSTVECCCRPLETTPLRSIRLLRKDLVTGPVSWGQAI